ncbi:MAG: phospho-sugar mutase, partial [Rhodoglobus sp.]|nr:phospho-sugar mutase [Rhodoglobus sp.]
GAFASGQISVRVDDLAEIPRLMSELRSAPPATVGIHDVASIDDFIDGFGAFPPGNILRIRFDNGARVIVRPSGTEPKLKIYIDASSTDGDASARQSNAAAIVAELDAGMRTLLHI